MLQSNQATETFRVAPGDTIHLGCNISYHIDTTWIKHASGHNPVIVLAARMANSGKLTVGYSASPSLGADVVNRSIALHIAGVSEPDFGLYYCVGIEGNGLQIGKATLLQGPPLSFCLLYTASLGSGLLAMISAVITVHLKTRRRRAQ
uniref:Ig-like domain-containing protein n=1 Tax=Paramormyrops kingsleyae TaxID=1676925 RepID=A0A3B3T069_9TELE